MKDMVRKCKNVTDGDNSGMSRTLLSPFCESECGGSLGLIDSLTLKRIKSESPNLNRGHHITTEPTYLGVVQYPNSRELNLNLYNVNSTKGAPEKPI